MVMGQKGSWAPVLAIGHWHVYTYGVLAWPRIQRKQGAHVIRGTSTLASMFVHLVGLLGASPW